MESIEKYVAWCRKFNLKPSDANNILKYAQLQTK